MKTKKWCPVVKAAPESLDADKRTLRAVISNNSVDRDGEVIEPSAFQEHIKTFLANPVLLWNHDPRNPPIGKVPGVEFFDDRMEADVQFRKAGDDPLADSVFSLYDQGILTSFSIGFRVLPGGYEEGGDDGKGNIKPPRITKGELLELSSVTIPANTGAVAKAVEMARVLQSGVDVSRSHMGSDWGQVVTPESVKFVSSAQEVTTYTALSDVDMVKRAADIVERMVAEKAKGNDVPDWDVVQNLRVLLLGSKAVKEPVLSDDFAKALSELGEVVSSTATELAPSKGGEN